MESFESRSKIDSYNRSIILYFSIIGYIFSDIACCFCFILCVFFALPATFAAPISKPGYPYLNSPQPSYSDFVSAESNDTPVAADIEQFGVSGVGFEAWKHRAGIVSTSCPILQPLHSILTCFCTYTKLFLSLRVSRISTDLLFVFKIRSSGNPDLCMGNLSVALKEVGAAYQASSSGSATLLTLLPTAGALIGAPAKELWVLWNLVPVAGLLSIALSLGGNITPRQVGDYASLEKFTYSGIHNMQPSERLKARSVSNTSLRGDRGECEDAEQDVLQAAERFANHVRDRASSSRGSEKAVKIVLGIVSLCICIALIITACWLLQSGAIIVWWCMGTYWTFAWYAVTIAASVIEFIANMPYGSSWTMRISKAPHLSISSDAPWVIPNCPESDPPTQQYTDISNTTLVTTSLLSTQTSQSLSVIDSLKKGYNTVGRVYMDPMAPWAASKDPFYVIISCEGIQNTRSVVRAFSKLFSVGAFTFSTALFASSSLVQISIATVVMTTILTAGIFGRVITMWISAIIMQDKPVLHHSVRNEKDAGVFMEAVLRKEGLICEVLGHVIINGRCVKRQSRLSWSSVLGVLARPFDVTKISVSSPGRRHASTA